MYSSLLYKKCAFLVLNGVTSATSKHRHYKNEKRKKRALLYIDLQPAIYLAVVGNRFLGIPGGMAKDSGGEKRLHSK